MKNIIFAIIATMALPAFADNICSKSWSDVNKSRYDVEFSKIQMDSYADQIGTVFMSVDGLCIAGSKLQTVAPVEICTEVAHNEAGNCTKTQQEILSTPINFLHPIQVGESDQFELVPEIHPTTYMIPVGRSGESFAQVCVKEFKIPNCQM